MGIFINSVVAGLINTDYIIQMHVIHIFWGNPHLDMDYNLGIASLRFFTITQQSGLVSLTQGYGEDWWTETDL